MKGIFVSKYLSGKVNLKPIKIVNSIVLIEVYPSFLNRDIIMNGDL